MKPKAATPVVLTARCTYHTVTGRRCRLFVSDAHSSLCRQHRAEQIHDQSADHHPHLTRHFQGFQTAQGINYSLKGLYELLAQNRISPRRASVLAYINSLLLRTLPQIDADRAAGIIDPTLPKPLPKPLTIPVQAKDASHGSGSKLNGNLPPASVSSAALNNPSAPVANSASAWDPSLLEPNPNKKPS